MQRFTETNQLSDRRLFLFVYPLMTLGIVHIGNDNPLLTLLQLPSYYSDLLLAALLTYGVGVYLQQLCRRLDQQYDWEKTLRVRLVRQLQYGLLLPLFTVMGIELLYLYFILHIPLRHHSFIYLELPLTFLFLLLINMVYLFLYFRKFQLSFEQQFSTPTQPDDILVQTGAKVLRIPTEEVAYFVKREGVTFLRTKGGEQFLYDLPLERIAARLDEQAFFQLNRQLIAHRHSIQSYVATDTRKLDVALTPEPGSTVYVSKARSGHFIRWMAGK